jgi:putative flippase GtrA
MPSRWARLLTFARSALAGGAATLVDLGVLGFAVTVLHVPAAVANAPAAIAGAAVQFFGNRSFAFRSSGPLGRQALLFGAAELVTLFLNVALYQLVVTHVALQAAGALLARVVTTNVVFVLWSYPAWRRIFAPPPRDLAS